MRNLINELPSYWHEVPEMKELQRVIQKLFEDIEIESDKILLDTFIDTASEERISEWEKCLTVIPKGTLEQRRLYLKAVIRGFGKLNEEKVKSIVNALTGGGAIVIFEAGVITVKVLPPNNGEVYLFPDIERALELRKPAHLGLNVVRYYSTWDIIENRFTTWGEIKSHFEDWEEVRNYIEG